MNIDKLIKDNWELISNVAKKYHHSNNYDDFRQELLIEIWHFIECQYDMNKLDDPDIFLKMWINALGRRVSQRYTRERRRHSKLNEALQRNITELDVSHYLVGKAEKNDALIADAISETLTDFEKKIVYILDYQCSIGKVSYQKIGQKLGIKARKVCYHLENIRSKLKEYIENSKKAN